LETAKYLPGVKERVDQNETVDTAAIFRRRDQIVMGYDDTVGLVPLIQSTGVSIVRGFGKLAGEKSVTVTPRKGEPVTLTARLAVVLSTGSIPIMPDVPGLREAIPW
jgi:dihydrolipoamide dehydrogenase